MRSITHTPPCSGHLAQIQMFAKRLLYSKPRGTGWPGCCECLYTPSYMHEFPPGFVCLYKDSWYRLFVSFGQREQVTGKGGTMLRARTLKNKQQKKNHFELTAGYLEMLHVGSAVPSTPGQRHKLTHLPSSHAGPSKLLQTSPLSNWSKTLPWKQPVPAPYSCPPQCPTSC